MRAYHLFHRILFVYLFTLLMVSCAFPVNAADYYADVSIVVDASGFVTIEGTTNHPDLLVEDSELYTTKKQSYWLLNITKQEVFSAYVYSLVLPEGASINYIKSEGFLRIEEHQGSLVVNGFGENGSFSVTLQYQLGKPGSAQQSLNLDSVTLLLVLAIGVVCLLLIYFYMKEKRTLASEKPAEPPLFHGVNQRQQEILKLLQERNTPLTQTEIQNALQIPKAAVSRNIRGLEQKGLIEKEQIGMSNRIRLKKP